MELVSSEFHPKQMPAFLALLIVAIVAKRFSSFKPTTVIHSISDMNRYDISASEHCHTRQDDVGSLLSHII